MPMVASDVHYGANIKMMGVGNYKVTIMTNRRQQVCTVIQTVM